MVSLVKESSVQLLNEVHLEAEKYGNAYLDESTEKLFIDCLPLTSCSEVCMFWGCKLRTDLTENVWYADTLLDQQHGRIKAF